MDMSSHLAIGAFARATHITVKALRHYHDQGLLVPVDVDPDSGYRYYSGEQVGRGQLIRRLREMDMPLADVGAVLDAPSDAERDAAIASHLQRMEAELERTREVVGSLRELLSAPPSPIEVRWTEMPALAAFARTAVVPREEIGPWCEATFPLVFGDVIAAGRSLDAPAGAMFTSDFFELGEGEVTVYVPVAPGDGPTGDSEAIEVPGAQFGVAEHHGDYGSLDRTYGALAQVIADSGVGLDLPIRERYVVSMNHGDDPSEFVTEVCWPVSGTPAN